ncbi:MAG: hypothetical protein ACREDZ_00195 [Kiloniellales bacterium]
MAAFLLVACDSGGEGPYLEFLGGGFVFDDQIAAAYCGFIARKVRDIPNGTILEAHFEDPTGGPPLVTTQIAQNPHRQFSFRSPPLKGVVAGRDYEVELRLISPTDRKLLASYSTSFRPSAEQAGIPLAAPAAIGPGVLADPQVGNR